MFRVVFPAVMVLDLLVPFLVALPYKGYSYRRTVMSVLGARESPLAWVYNLWTILSGAVFVWAGFVLYGQYAQQPVLRVLLLVLLGLYGVGCEIVSGLFPTGADKAEMSTSAKVHGVGSVIGFMALLFAPLVLGLTLLRSGVVWIGVVSLVSFVLALVSFALFVMAEKPAFQGTAIGQEGLWQRVALALMYLPFFLWVIV